MSRRAASPRPLLDRHARDRRVAVLERSQFDPAADFAAATAFEAGCHTRLVPRPPAAVLQHLTTVEHVIDPATGQLGRRPLSLVLPQGDHLEVPWGLAPLIAQAERCLTHRPAAGPLDDGVLVRSHPTVSDPLVVAHLLAHRRLVVRHGRGVNVACLIAALAVALPGKRIAVISPRRRDVGHLTAGLTALGIDAAAFYTAGDYDARPPRVAVGTSAGLTSSAAQHAGCSVVVTLDAINFIGSGGASARYERAWANARWLGLVPADRTPSPLEWDRLVCFYGPAALTVPVHGAVTRNVLFAHQPLVLPERRGGERVVVRLAGELTVTGPRACGGWFAVVGAATGVAGSVVVLANDEPHRRQLERAQRPADRDRVRVVVPAELAELAEVGILVRADCRPGRPSLAPSAKVEPQLARRPLLVVDAIGPDEDRLAGRRESAYRAAGWVSLTAFRNGSAEWELWSGRRLPGRGPTVAPYDVYPNT